MSVQFEFAPIPVPADRKRKVRYYARVVNRKAISTKEIVEEIERACTLTETDVYAVLDALNHSLARHLKEGKRIHLDGIGFFDITLACPETRDPKATRASKVKCKGVNFRMDKKLRYRMGDLKAERSKAGNHSAKLSDIEIDMRLTVFFEENLFLTRADLQSLCHMTRITAGRCINRLIAEKKLKNANTKSQPIYVPEPGNYHISANK